MREFNYLWLPEAEICQRLQLGPNCVSKMPPMEQVYLPRYEGRIRADAALKILRPDWVGSVCLYCLLPLEPAQERYCCVQHRNLHQAASDSRAAEVCVAIPQDMMAQLISDARSVELGLQEFLTASLEYGRHNVLRFQRTGKVD